MQTTNSQTNSAGNYELPTAQLIYVEDLNPDMDRKLAKTVLTPYFQSVFSDLSLRSTPPSKTDI
jgi:hypothetical protein